MNGHQTEIDTLTATGQTNNLLTAQSEYNAAKAAFDNNWYQAEIDKLQEIVLGIDALKNAYYNALNGTSATGTGAGAASIAGNAGATSIAGNAGANSTANWEGMIKSYYNYYMGTEHSVGTGANQIPQEAMDYWLAKYGNTRGAIKMGTGFDSDFRLNAWGMGFAPERGFREGGIFSGPDSGYPVNTTFHGTEAVIPLDKLGTSELIDEVKLLRKEVNSLRAENSAGQIASVKSTQKIEQYTRYLEQWDAAGLPATEA
jgi:hypothetical protein